MPGRESSPHPNVQKAVAFFTQAGLTRVLARLREKYIEQGRIGGQVLLTESTQAERREVASFLGRTPSASPALKIRLVDMDMALQLSGFCCTLPALLEAFFPDQPLVTRKARHAAHVAHQDAFQAALQAIMASRPAPSRSRTWLEQGRHGATWLFARSKNATKQEQERQLSIIHAVAAALDHLPDGAKPQRLALFAQNISGDPHSLDPERPAGRLLLLALDDLSNSSSASPPQDRAGQLRLYQEAGLLIDTISSSVAAFHLASAVSHDGTLDPWIQAAGERVLLLPLRQLFAWHKVHPCESAIYVLENPQVFEEVIAGLPEGRLWPTVICTAGWPSLAATTLLDLLLAASPTYPCYYSGDFDVKGLQIAAYLLARYPGRLQPWHLSAEDYAIALQHGGVTATPGDLEQLRSLPDSFTPLVASMQEKRQWAYQEGIAHLLLGSLLQL